MPRAWAWRLRSFLAAAHRRRKSARQRGPQSQAVRRSAGGTSRLGLRAGLCVAGMALALGLFSGISYSHALLTSASPNPGTEVTVAPAQLVLHFSEGLNPALSTVKVLDVASHTVATHVVVNGPAATITVSFDRALPTGRYTVVWTSVSSDDGHLVRGSYTLGVGMPAAPPVPSAERGAQAGSAATANSAGALPGAARWLSWLGLFLWAGAALWQMLTRTHRAGAGWTTAAVQADLAARVGGRLDRLARWGALLFGVGLLAGVADRAAVLAGGFAGQPATWAHLLWGSSHGVWTTVRLLLALLGVIAARRWPVSIGAVAAGIVASGFAGHAAALPQFATAGEFAVQLHILAGLAWAGGIAAFGLAAVWPERRHPEELVRFLAPFWPWAVWGAIAVIATGFINADLEMAGRWHLLDTPYGTALAVKIGLVALLFLMSVLHVFVLRRTNRWWWRLLALQPLVVVLVLGATAVLTGYAPPRESGLAGAGIAGSASAADTRPLLLGEAAGPYQVRIAITPAQLGPNTFRVSVFDPLAQPVSDARVTLSVAPAAPDATQGSPVGAAGDTGNTAASGPAAGAPHRLAHQSGGVYAGHWDVAAGGPRILRVQVQRPGEQAWQTHVALSLPAPDARVILQRATANFLALHSVHMVQDLSDGRHLIETEADFQAPNLRRYLLSTGKEVITGPNGLEYTQKAPETPWVVTPAPAKIHWPVVDWSLPDVTAVHLIGEAKVGGHACWLVAFEDTRIGGIYFRLWIDEASLQVRRERMITTAHYMTATYSDFDAPVAIVAPAGAPAPSR